MRLLRWPAVQAKIGGWGRTYVDTQEREGKFPKRVKVGAHTVAWLESEIDAWIEAKAAQRDSDQLAA